MIKILADSTCDLSQDIIKKYNISIVPLSINIDGKYYKDGIDIKANEFYNIIEEIENHPTTSTPSPNEYINEINECVSKGYSQILCICMSSGTSGSYQSAIIAKKLFYDENPNSNVEIYVLDSLCMSHGSGWLVLKSAKLMENGATFEDIIKFNEKYKTSIKHFLSIDDLDHLIRSGRLTNASAFVGKLLRLKPIMTMKNSRGAIVAKERGLKKVLNHYVNEFLKRVDSNITDFIIIGYTSDIKVAENLKNKIIKETDFKGDIFIMQMGVVVGNHVGLGAISMFFAEKGHKKDNLLVNEINELVEKKNSLLDKLRHSTN